MAAPAPTTTLLVIRHGETHWNREERFQGHGDSPLTKLGREQARALGRRMRSIPFDTLICSDLGRAQETAALIAAETGHTVHSEPRIRERNFGVLEGLTVSEIKARYNDIFQRLYHRNDTSFVIPEGESLSQHHARCSAFFAELVADRAGRRIALVVHGGVLDSLMRVVQDAPLAQPRWFISANTALNVVHHGVFYRTVRWVIETWGDVGHLDGVGHRLGLA
jgi:probable phosphoglycerate mutase